ncbi:MAG TPA: NTF2 fold immunity protein [Roseomonas sp.]|jgi:hypothetical protein
MGTSFQLLGTPERAVELAEVILRLAYGPEQLEEERPLVAEDLGEQWRVCGTRMGTHAMPYFPVSSIITMSKKTGAIVNYQLHRPLPEALQRHIPND